MTTEKSNMKLGYNTAGCEKAFEKYLAQAITCTGNFTYLEIGIAEGTTLLAVADLARKLGAGRDFATALDWTAIGVDLLEGPFFNLQRFGNMAHEIGLGFDVFCPFNRTHEMYPGLHVLLADDPRRFVSMLDPLLDFVLIDGCHGAPCVKADFLAIENLVYQGGIVAFHDALPEDQGRDLQVHCGEPINVRQALYDLNLLEPPPEQGKDWPGIRHGWKLLEEVLGDKSANPPGNGMVFFQKE